MADTKRVSLTVRPVTLAGRGLLDNAYSGSDVALVAFAGEEQRQWLEAHDLLDALRSSRSARR